MSLYLKIEVSLSLEDYLAGIIELVRQGLLQPTSQMPIRVAGGYFRKRAPGLLLHLPDGIVVEDGEVLFPHGYHGDVRRNAPAQVIVDRYLLSSASNDLAWGQQGGATICYLSKFDSRQPRTLAVNEQVERASLLMREVRRAGSQGFTPVWVDLEKGEARLTGPGGIIVLKAGAQGQVEMWGEQFNPAHGCKRPMQAIAAGDRVVEDRPHLVSRQALEAKS